MNVVVFLAVLALCVGDAVAHNAKPVCISGYIGLRNAQNCRKWTCVWAGNRYVKYSGTCPEGRCFVPSLNFCAKADELRCGSTFGTDPSQPPRVFAVSPFNKNSIFTQFLSG